MSVDPAIEVAKSVDGKLSVLQHAAPFRIEDATAAGGSELARHPASALMLTSALVLLVEGDRVSRLSSANDLLDRGYEVVESESASEAMSILDGRNDFDAMIADIDLDHAPGGLALMRYAASHHPLMKILINSAGNDAQAEASAVAASFLSKPYPVGALVRRMQGLVPMQSAPTHGHAS